MGNLIIVTGGARSGKSSYALQRGEQIPGARHFLATCPVTDAEMSLRIDRHRQERQGRGWRSIEEETDIAGRIEAIEESGPILIDCLTLWLNNLLYRAELEQASFDEKDVAGECQRLLLAVSDCRGTVICVTNEVGMGIVPDNPLARRYRDLVGCCNRILAVAAEEVVLVSCGIPLILKSANRHRD
jgi:adenosylcobinamide kinase / adenosylcobinamide-phosphate guanylyltransferase